MTTPRPPRLAEALLELILSPNDRAHALGDLHEEYGSLHRAGGRGAANRWYWSQVLGALGPSLGRRLRSPVSTLPRLAGQSRLAFRALRRRPGLVVTGVTTLALGIGAATAIFSVADAVLFRPLPYPEGDRLVTIWDTYDDWRGHEVLSGYWDRIPLSWPELIDLRERQTSFEEFAAYGTASATLTGAGDPEEVLVGYASATLLPLLGAPLHLGRTFSADEVGQGAPRLAVLSYELWRDRYGEDPDLAGRRVVLDDRSFQVIGVLRPGFHLSSLGPFAPGTGRHALWLPIGADGSPLERGSHAYETLGHLAPGVTLERAATEAASILWADRDPDTRGVRVALRRDEEIGDTERLHDLPGVEGATAISAVPFSGRGGSSSFDLVGRDPPLGAPDPEALRRTVLPDYHSVMRIPLVEGRYLEPSDRTEDAPVVVVSESMARRYWPDGFAVGSRIERDRREWEIVGIVGDVLHADLSAEALPTFYVPLDVAEARSTMTLVVRSGLPPGDVADQLRTTVWEVDPGLPVEDVATADALLAGSTAEERFRTLLVTAFALIATLMCAVGLFGVVARGVSARTSELGIRLALGARTSTLLGHVLAREIPPLVAGVALGVAGSVAAGTLLAGFLFEVGPRDPTSLGLGVAVLTGATLVAILAAARRALGLDPLRAIRAE